MAMAEESNEKSILDELAHSETVRKLIECPVCLELPLPPIYVCNKGHIVCNNCQARTYVCPLCREHYSTTRGFVAEGIIEKCILRCKHADQGCPLTMRGAVLVDHVDVCDYRPVKCIDCGGKLINFDEYEDHLLKYHKINGIYQSRAYVIYSMNLTHQIAFGEKCCWPQYYIKAFDDVTFLLRLYATHWFVCAWISLLGPKTECSKYEALLEFHPTQDDSVVHTWQGPVNHFRDDPAKQIFLQGRGLITPMETLMQIAPVTQDHAEWLYNIEILQTNSDKLDSGVGADAIANDIEGDAIEELAPTNSERISNDKVSEEHSSNTSSSTSPDAESPPPNPQTSAPVLKMTTTRSAEFEFSDSRVTPACPPLRTPRALAMATVRTSRNTVLSPGPATVSPSTSNLASAATVTSVDSNRGGRPMFPWVGSTQGQGPGPVSVSTARNPRLESRLTSNLRRGSALCAFLSGGNSRSLTFTEEDWNYSSEDDDEE